jgi:hypothetical protein
MVIILPEMNKNDRVFLLKNWKKCDIQAVCLLFLQRQILQEFRTGCIPHFLRKNMSLILFNEI